MIAVDIMGGDFAPQASLAGALNAARKKIPVLLCGPKDLIVSSLNKMDTSWLDLPIKILDATEIIEMGEEPVRATLKKQQSSLVKAVKSVKDNEASAVISAGNSGALMAAATFVLGREDGVERPAIVGFLPGIKGRVLCLDLGANTECKPSYLEQFARLGANFLGGNPRVGLLSNGSEPGKGSALVKETYAVLEQSGLNFIGNVEPVDIVKNNVDVVVCDGFTGNILLKTMESTSRMILGLLKEAGEVQIAQSIAEKMSLSVQGGAQLLGVKGTVIVAHGCANELDIENAIINAWKICSRKKGI